MGMLEIFCQTKRYKSEYQFHSFLIFTVWGAFHLTGKLNTLHVSPLLTVFPLMESTSPAGDKRCGVCRRRCRRGDVNGKRP